MPFRDIIRVAALTGCLGIPSAFAEKFYGAFDLGQSTAKAACSGIPSWVSDCKNTADAYRLAAGYVIDPQWSAEFSYAEYGQESAGRTPYATSVNWLANGMQLSGIGKYSVSPVTSLVGKLGLAVTDLHLSGSATASARRVTVGYGLGAQFSLNKDFSARVQYENLGIIGNDSTGTTRLTLFSFGLIRYF